MTNFRLMVTNEGKHPASKWAELATEEIIEISNEAPEALLREASSFREGILQLLTHHHQHMMDDEQKKIKSGKHAMHLPLVTEDHADFVVDEICKLAEGTSFENHFSKQHVRDHLSSVCNRYFKSAKLVERQHHHTEKERAAAAKSKKN